MKHKPFALASSVLSLMLLLLPASAGLAQDKGGFVDPAAPSSESTVAEALKMRDDARVTLTGKIERSLGDERYIFRDNSGSIRVEIDDDLWAGRTFSPDDRVKIYGEIDRDFNDIEVEVKSITKL